MAIAQSGPHTMLHPPKPGLAIRVGFAGAREKFNPELGGLRGQFAGLLKQIAEDAQTLHAERACYDPHQPVRLIFICSLAFGADQFAAQLALDAGYELQVPLAWPRAEYAQRNFQGESETGLKTFNRLLSHERTTSILELDGAEEEDDAYDAAGTVIVNHSDILLAIWDLSKGKGPGGTADSVKKAGSAGLPVVVFNSGKEEPAELRYKDADKRKPAELTGLLRAYLNFGIDPIDRLLAQPGEDGNFDARLQRKYLATYYKEKERVLDLALPYAVIISLLTRSWVLRARIRGYEVQSARNWRVAGSKRWIDRPKEYFRPLDRWADSLAVFYAHWMRGVVATILVGGAILACVSLASTFWQPLFHPYFVSYLGLISVLFVAVVVFSQSWEVQRRWMDYRTLSELLRNFALSAPLGGLHIDRHRFHSRQGFSPSWVLFYYQAVVRYFGLCPGSVTEDYLRDYKHLLSTRLREQIDYHDQQEKKCAMLHERIRTFGLCAFALTLLTAIAIPVLTLLSHVSLFSPAHLKAVLAYSQQITSAVYLLGIVSAAIAGFAAQENFARLGQVSNAIRQRLTQLVNRLDKSPLTGSALREIAGAAVETTIQEHAGWILLTSLREIPLPS